jgi:hypothetical protein
MCSCAWREGGCMRLRWDVVIYIASRIERTRRRGWQGREGGADVDGKDVWVE